MAVSKYLTELLQENLDRVSPTPGVFVLMDWLIATRPKHPQGPSPFSESPENLEPMKDQ